MLHDHRRDDGVERAVGDLRDLVGGRDDGTDPREPRETRSRRAASRSIAYTGFDDETCPRDERGEERPVTAAEVGERERPRRQQTCEQRWKLRRRSGSPSRCTARSRERGYAPPGRQSPVSPSQQPTLNRQRGHWNVPCRHSMCAPQRMQISTARDGLAATLNLRTRGGRLRCPVLAPWPRG